MKNYNLRADEVVLYKGEVIFENEKGSTELILTNLNLVFINRYKKFFSEEEVTVIEYPAHSIKVYEGLPQIKTKGSNVEIYLLDNELEFKFNSKMELHKFINETNKLLTGESSVQKRAKKVKEAIALVDDTLGISTVQATGDIVKNGVVVGFVKIGKSIFNKKK